MEHIKSLIIGFITGITAYLHPINGDLESLFAVFLLNFLFGLLAGLLISGESFSFKKAWKCIVEATLILTLICCIYFIGEHKGNPDGALQCVSFVVYSVFYFYGVNILRNMKELAPENSRCYMVISFLYYVVSVEFIKKIPYLVDYLNTKKVER